LNADMEETATAAADDDVEDGGVSLVPDGRSKIITHLFADLAAISASSQPRMRDHV